MVMIGLLIQLKQGIITKPVNGSGGKDVYRFQVLEESLYREKLTQK